jgi:hypothetical protein
MLLGSHERVWCFTQPASGLSPVANRMVWLVSFTSLWWVHSKTSSGANRRVLRSNLRSELLFAAIRRNLCQGLLCVYVCRLRVSG